MEFQGKYFKRIRGFLRKLNRFRYDLPDRSVFTEPAVYVCRHNDNRGPVITMVNLQIPVHPWAYYVWCDEEACRKQCVDYTFTIRFGWKREIADLAARIIAKPLTSLIRSAGAIPVYRNSLRVRETFRESVDALKRGESLLIFPDVDYTSRTGDTGALYDGFLMLERLYHKETGLHLPFVPMHISGQEKKLSISSVISFRDGVSFKEEKERVIQALHDALNNPADR